MQPEQNFGRNLLRFTEEKGRKLAEKSDRLKCLLTSCGHARRVLVAGVAESWRMVASRFGNNFRNLPFLKEEPVIEALLSNS
jgi:hypothetical protein